MTLSIKHKLTQDEIELGLLLTDTLLFTLFFWADDLTIPEHRLDLPERWRGKQVLTKEQRLMYADGSVYFLLRDTCPEDAAKSSQKIIVRTSRKIGKTIGFESRYIQAAITNTKPGTTEGLFHAPGDAHIAPVLKRIDSKVDKEPLFALLHASRNMSAGIDSFRCGPSTYVWHRRLEGMSGTGRNMVGLRAYNELGDEGDYSAEAPFEERQQTDLPGCAVWWGGVPRGIRGVFWRIARTAAGSAWSRHVQGLWRECAYDMRACPLYHSDEAWSEAVGHESYDSHRVQTQVLGLDGEAARSTFPIIAVDPKLPFCQASLRSSDVSDDEALADVLRNIPLRDVAPYKDFIIHADYGFSPSPLVVGVSYQRATNVWAELARFSLLGVDNVLSAKFIHHVNRALPMQARVICIDAHGRGAGTLENLQKQAEYAAMGYNETVIPAAFETSTPDPRLMAHTVCGQIARELQPRVWICDTCRTVVSDARLVRPVKVQSKQLLTASLAEALSEGQRWLDEQHEVLSEAVVLAADPDLVEELQGTTSVPSSSGHVRFEPPHKDQDHSTDSWRALMRALRRIKQMMEDKIAPFAEYGWF